MFDVDRIISLNNEIINESIIQCNEGILRIGNQDLNINNLNKTEQTCATSPHNRRELFLQRR